MKIKLNLCLCSNFHFSSFFFLFFPFNVWRRKSKQYCSIPFSILYLFKSQVDYIWWQIFDKLYSISSHKQFELVSNIFFFIISVSCYRWDWMWCEKMLSINKAKKKKTILGNAKILNGMRYSKCLYRWCKRTKENHSDENDKKVRRTTNVHEIPSKNSTPIDFLFIFFFLVFFVVVSILCVANNRIKKK